MDLGNLLVAKIESPRNILALLKKRSLASMSDQNKENSSSTSTKEKQKAFDFAALLKKLRQKIKTIHMNTLVTGDVESKPTLQLLNVSSLPQ